MSFSKEWTDGFDAGMAWCEMLSKSEEGSEHEFFPEQQGGYRNGFAEGTITGRSKYEVTWRWIDPINRPNIVSKGPKLKIITLKDIS